MLNYNYLKSLEALRASKVEELTSIKNKNNWVETQLFLLESDDSKSIFEAHISLNIDEGGIPLNFKKEEDLLKEIGDIDVAIDEYYN